ncbi:T-complex protein 11-like protein 1 [Liolophura sinensis]|uniref:T-complex protein 11-like protein 1 n=1 Tax=Liolophura sinensis TaxID=3198878 RepID=UPI0031591944
MSEKELEEVQNQPDDNQNESELEDSSDTKKRRTTTPIPTPSSNADFLAVPASPPKFISFQDLMTATKGVRNMTLAHEIAVDNDFKLEKYEPQAQSVEKRVHDIMHQAFWDLLQEQLNADPPDYTPALNLLGEVKEKLLSLLLPQHVRLRAQIEEVLDMELIKQKMEKDAFDIHYYSGYVIDTMAKLCAPIRDENIQKLRTVTEVVPLFKEIFQLLEMMGMDMANYTIQQMRPYIQQQSVEYERKKFQDLLEVQKQNGRDGLQFTKLWLSRNLKKLQESSSSLGAAAASSITPVTVLNEAYMELLNWDDKETFPETLLMDQNRFLELRDKTKRLTLISAVLLLTYHTVGTPIVGVQALKQTLQSRINVLLDGVQPTELKEKMAHVAEEVNKVVGETLRELGFQDREKSKEDNLKGQIVQVLDESHTVHQVIRSRVHQFIYQTSFSSHSEPKKIPQGLSTVQKDLVQVCGQFLRLIAHNRSVFSIWYSSIIEHLLEYK